ncbi:MAG: TonB-dependent receptor [Campylobacteraceae bacterium]|nr:TonB-dependent receptor [Campylobacteraceae bacterium]
MAAVLTCLALPLTADEINPSANASTALNATTATSSSSAAKELEAIKVVSASGYEQNIADAPASVYVITKEELEKKSFNDLMDVLKNVPGVYVSGGSTGKDILIRGMGRDYTLYLIDGKPMANTNEAYSLNGGGAGFAVNTLPPVSMIERIEIVRGPMSSLYGSEAMGGVINIITKKIPQEWSGTMKGEFTKSYNDRSEGGYQTSINVAGPLIPDLLSLQTYGSSLKVDESEFIGGNSNYDNRNFGAKTVLKINDANSAWLNYEYSKQKSATSPGKSIAANATASNTVQSIRETYAIGHDLKLNDFDISTYLQQANRINPNRGGITYDVLTFNTQANYFFNTNALTFGAQYKKEELDDTGTNKFANKPILSRWSYSLFAEDEWEAFDNLALIGGIRFNDSEAFETYINPCIYAVYHITDNLIAKGGVASGYKAPTLRQSSDDFAGVTGGGSTSRNYIMVGNPNLNPETSISYEAALEYDNKDAGFAAGLTIYHTDYKDKIATLVTCENSVTPAPGNEDCPKNGEFFHRVSEYFNIADSAIEGVEATLRYNILRNLLLSATYTYTTSEQKSGSSKGEPLNSVAKHMASASADLDVTERFSLWSQYTYTGAYKEASTISVTNAAKNKAYSLVDIGTVVKLKNGLRFNLGIYNLLNKEITSDTLGKFIDGRRATLSFVSDF